MGGSVRCAVGIGDCFSCSGGFCSCCGMSWLSSWLRPSWSSGVVLVARGCDGAAVLVSCETTKVAAVTEKTEAETEKVAAD